MNIVKPADLKQGDVLLFHGNGVLSRFIRLFDGSQYSHAAIWDGTNVVEAEAESGNGIKVDQLAVSSASASYTHVYRFVSDDRKRLGVELPYEPVEKNVESFKNTPEAYAYSQILLLGVLLATRHIPLPGVTQLLRPLLDEAAEHLNQWLNGGKKVIICSELVYECFFLTGKDEYQIEVAGVDPDVVSTGLTPRHTLMPTTTPDSDMAHLQKDAAAFLASYRIATNRPGDLKPTDEHGEPRAVPEFVTPRDLATSPNLALVGQLAL
jgi:hypothetical protein